MQVSNLSPTIDLNQANHEQRREMLRQTASELVGVTFFAPMLKMAHNSVLEGKYGHGGRGEKAFQGQLDLELSRRMGQAMNNDLTEAIFNRYEKRV